MLFCRDEVPLFVCGFARRKWANLCRNELEAFLMRANHTLKLNGSNCAAAVANETTIEVTGDDSAVQERNHGGRACDGARRDRGWSYRKVDDKGLPRQVFHASRGEDAGGNSKAASS